MMLMLKICHYITLSLVVLSLASFDSVAAFVNFDAFDASFNHLFVDDFDDFAMVDGKI